MHMGPPQHSACCCWSWARTCTHRQWSPWPMGPSSPSQGLRCSYRAAAAAARGTPRWWAAPPLPPPAPPCSPSAPFLQCGSGCLVSGGMPSSLSARRCAAESGETAAAAHHPAAPARRPGLPGHARLLRLRSAGRGWVGEPDTTCHDATVPKRRRCQRARGGWGDGGRLPCPQRPVRRHYRLRTACEVGSAALCMHGPQAAADVHRIQRRL